RTYANSCGSHRFDVDMAEVDSEKRTRLKRSPSSLCKLLSGNVLSGEKPMIREHLMKPFAALHSSSTSQLLLTGVNTSVRRLFAIRNRQRKHFAVTIFIPSIGARVYVYRQQRFPPN